MSLGKMVKAGPCLEWTFQRPAKECPSESPNFLYQGCECSFVLFPGGFYFKLWIMIKHGPVPQLFPMTVMGAKDGMLFRKAVFIDTAPSFLGKFSYLEFSSKTEKETEATIKFIFDSDEDLTLSLDTEQGASENSTSSIDRLEILSRNLSKLLDEDLYQDVDVKCGEQTFKVHRAILCSRSEIFKAMLQSDMVEGRTARVDLKDMDSDICKDFIRYLYTGQLPELTTDIAKGLYEAGDRFGVDGLMTPCADYLEKNLTPDNACEIFILADAHNDKSFKENVIAFILNEKIPPQEDIWQAFSDCQSKLSSEVLFSFYKATWRG